MTEIEITLQAYSPHDAMKKARGKMGDGWYVDRIERIGWTDSYMMHLINFMDRTKVEAI